MSKLITYKVYKDGRLDFIGNRKKLLHKYAISNVTPYTNTGKLLYGEYKIISFPVFFVPKEKDEYYYYSAMTECPVKKNFSLHDTNSIMYLACGNVFRPTASGKEQCNFEGSKVIDDVLEYYKELVEEYENID